MKNGIPFTYRMPVPRGFRPAPVADGHKKTVEEYIAGHLPRWCTDKSPCLSEMYDRCRAGTFVPADAVHTDAQALHGRVSAYIRAVLADDALLAEPYLYRNLAVILRELYACSEEIHHTFLAMLADDSSLIFGISLRDDLV